MKPVNDTTKYIVSNVSTVRKLSATELIADWDAYKALDIIEIAHIAPLLIPAMALKLRSLAHHDKESPNVNDG